MFCRAHKVQQISEPNLSDDHPVSVNGNHHTMRPVAAIGGGAYDGCHASFSYIGEVNSLGTPAKIECASSHDMPPWSPMLLMPVNGEKYTVASTL
jgi:hypothetical protein